MNNIPKERRSFKDIIRGLFTINDSPNRIALGLGLGVFCGILPGTGPIAAVFLALLFRVNRAASLIGSLATNTWLSFVTFVIAVKAGAWVYGVDWVKVYSRSSLLIRQFRWLDMFRLSFLKLVLPLFTGYILVGLGLGLGVYLITLTAFKVFKQGSQSPEKSRI